MKTALVTGAAGFIGSHLVKYLKSKSYRVIAADLQQPEFAASVADEYIVGDLRDPKLLKELFQSDIDEVYQMAADMGGAGYLFSGENDANVMYNSATINLGILKAAVDAKVKKIFYPSSACVYPSVNPKDPGNPNYTEDCAYPAQPESEYGWEKLFSERLYFSFMRNYGIDVKIARFHTIYGPEGSYDGGKEKAPSALARKVALAANNGEIEIWGDGEQTRSFLYVDDCVDAVYKLVQSDFSGPVNIGSDELISINDLANRYIAISGKHLSLKHIDGPVGIQGRNSDNSLIAEKLAWAPQVSLQQGLEKTYHWIAEQIHAS